MFPLRCRQKQTLPLRCRITLARFVHRRQPAAQHGQRVYVKTKQIQYQRNKCDVKKFMESNDLQINKVH